LNGLFFLLLFFLVGLSFSALSLLVLVQSAGRYEITGFGFSITPRRASDILCFLVLDLVLAVVLVLAHGCILLDSLPFLGILRRPNPPGRFLARSTRRIRGEVGRRIVFTSVVERAWDIGGQTSRSKG
jgi:hypothetical protein